MESTEGCGHCKECMRLRKLNSRGCKPCEPIECAYKHILDIYKDFDGTKMDDGDSKAEGRPAVGSCGPDCRWISLSGSSTKYASYDDSYGCHGYYSDHVRRKRVIFSKRRRIPK